MKQTTNTNSGAHHGRTNHAHSVDASCHQGATAGGATAAQRANRQPTASDGANGQKRDTVTLATGKRNSGGTWYDKNGRERLCDWCRQPYVAKRSTSRFCSSNCRWHAHQQRHNDSEVTK